MLRRLTAKFMPLFIYFKIQWLIVLLNRSSCGLIRKCTFMVHCYILQCSLMVHRVIINQMLYFKQSLINNHAIQMITRSNFFRTCVKPLLNIEANVKRAGVGFEEKLRWVEP